MPSTLRLTNDTNAVVHLAEWTGNGKWRSVCNVLDNVMYNDAWGDWTGRTHRRAVARVRLGWFDEQLGGSVCTRCISRWAAEVAETAEFLTRAGAAWPEPSTLDELAARFPQAVIEPNGSGEVVVYTGLSIDANDTDRLTRWDL